MEPGEAYFFEHCDEPGCDLGTFEYVCPECKGFTIDYEVWWKEDDIWKGEVVKFKCEKCGAELTVEWDKENYCFVVKHLKS